jgi:membrane protease YdiL (CAAX protease family)
MIPLLATSLREEQVQATILTAFLAVSGAIWIGLYLRWQRKEPIIPLARRRPVPWKALDVLFIFLIGSLLPWMAVGAVQAWMGPATAQRAADQKPELAHPAEQVLRRGTPCEKAVTVVMTVIIAPLFEEFLFRVLLQGWLEALWSRWRRKHPELKSAPMSWLPFVLPAALFALLHLRAGKEPLPSRYLTGLFLGQMAADLLTLALAIAVLRSAAGATAADLGWKPEKLRADAKLGLLALLAVIGPLLALQFGLVLLVKWKGINYALDPIPLFLLALVFGVLYHRTHRLAPSLVLHIAFNATSIIGVFAG